MQGNQNCNPSFTNVSVCVCASYFFISKDNLIITSTEICMHIGYKLNRMNCSNEIVNVAFSQLHDLCTDWT